MRSGNSKEQKEIKAMSKTMYKCDVAILSVTTTEFQAVMHFHDWKAKTILGDDQIYDVAEFERNEKSTVSYTPE